MIHGTTAVRAAVNGASFQDHACAHALALVQPYPATPTFGAPCSTTLFAIGLFCMSTPTVLLPGGIPILWAAIGGAGPGLLFYSAPAAPLQCYRKSPGSWKSTKPNT